MTAIPREPINEAPWGVDIGDWATALHEPLAGIGLGAYDERILTWIAGWDTPTVVTIVSLLHRARAAQPLTAAETEPRFDLITRRFTTSESGAAGGGQHIDRDLTAIELDDKLTEHGVTRHEGDKGKVTLADGLQLLWQPAGTEPIQ